MKLEPSTKKTVIDLQGKIYLTREGLAAFLAVSTSTVDQLRKRGALPPHAKTHRQRPILFLLDEVVACMSHDKPEDDHDA